MTSIKRGQNGHFWVKNHVCQNGTGRLYNCYMLGGCWPLWLTYCLFSVGGDGYVVNLRGREMCNSEIFTSIAPFSPALRAPSPCFVLQGSVIEVYYTWQWTRVGHWVTWWKGWGTLIIVRTVGLAQVQLCLYSQRLVQVPWWPSFVV